MPSDEVDELASVGHERFGEALPRLHAAVADEDDDVNQVTLVEAGQLRQALDVLVVLAKGVLELVLAAVDRLRPHRAIGVAEDSALHVLGLDDEHAESREHHVVDLRRASRLIRDHHIVDDSVAGGIEAVVQNPRDKPFAELALEPRRLQNRDDDEDRHHQPERRTVEHRRNYCVQHVGNGILHGYCIHIAGTRTRLEEDVGGETGLALVVSG